MADLTLSDRLALALCVSINGAAGCPIGPCDECRRRSAGVAHEIADYFSELYSGASTTADTLYALGCHQPDPPAGWPAITPGQEAAALAVGRELRRLND